MRVLLTIDTYFIDGAGDSHTGYVNSSWTVSEGAVLAASASNGDSLPIKISSNPDGGTLAFDWVADANTYNGRYPDRLTIYEDFLGFGPLIWDSKTYTGGDPINMPEGPPPQDGNHIPGIACSGHASIPVSAGCERLMLNLETTSSAAFHVTGMVFTPGTQNTPPPPDPEIPPKFIPFWTNLKNCKETSD